AQTPGLLPANRRPPHFDDAVPLPTTPGYSASEKTRTLPHQYPWPAKTSQKRHQLATTTPPETLATERPRPVRTAKKWGSGQKSTQPPRPSLRYRATRRPAQSQCPYRSNSARSESKRAR